LSPGQTGAFLTTEKEDVVDEPLFIVGTHHKTGTALMALVLRYEATQAGMPLQHTHTLSLAPLSGADSLSIFGGLTTGKRRLCTGV
jgi:hypothetical protein